MQLEKNTLYRCSNGAFVKVKQFSKSLLYKFKAVYVSHEMQEIIDAGLQEVWTINGEAIHYDCGWSIVEKIYESNT